jgi:hypothetical protein
MTTQANSPFTLTAGAAIAAFLRVKAAVRTAYLAGSVDYGIGTALEGVAINKLVAVRLWEHGGSHKCVASAAINAGAKVYAAAAGKVAPTGTLLIGTALDAASGNNSVIEVIPHIARTQSSSSSSSSSSG